jgi:hypothetical protein
MSTYRRLMTPSCQRPKVKLTINRDLACLAKPRNLIRKASLEIRRSLVTDK